MVHIEVMGIDDNEPAFEKAEYVFNMFENATGIEIEATFWKSCKSVNYLFVILWFLLPSGLIVVSEYFLTIRILYRKDLFRTENI